MQTALLLSFAVLLLIEAPISERVHPTVLSTAVPFLMGGLVMVFSILARSSPDVVIARQVGGIPAGRDERAASA